MQNIDIRDFTTVSTVETYDHVVLSLFGGVSAKMKVSLLRDVLVRGITPSIREDGTWYIGEEATGITAEGKTPEFRKGTAGIEYKYSIEGDSAWRTLVSYSDLRMRYEDLTEEQVKSLKLSFSDLTPEDIKELQKPAEDMISRLEETDIAVKEAETLRADAETKRAGTELERVQAELEREEAEKQRDSLEKARESAESARVLAEDIRNENEKQRILSEDVRSESEAERKAAETARESGESTRVSQESERVSAENARASAESSRASAEEDRVKEFARLKTDSEAATASAQDTADHPTYVGEDNYVYEWDKTAQTYNKTSVYVRGEAFSIKKVYTSIDEMYADVSTPFKEGDFCLINTGSVEDEETAQLFVRTASGDWKFVVDMSGAIGFTGKTPQLSIGTVSAGSGKTSAAVTISPNGEDTDGNPQYLINYVIPCLAYEDLTAEQIAELQRPASDMIAELQKTEDAVKQAEAIRVSAEEGRKEEFARLKSESENATSNAVDAANEANSARDAANVSAESANEAAGIARQSASTAEEAAEGANTAALAARNLPKIQNGTWWLYDTNLGTYVDSGYAVNNEYLLTREKVEEVLQGDVESHWHDRYIDKVEGKGLSTEDFTTALKERLESLDNYDDTAITAVVSTLRKDFDTLVGENATDAIESFNETISFLAGVSDAETLDGIVAGIGKQIAEKADRTELPTKVSELENDVPFATSSELASGLAEKQPSISDLDSIRKGAALGATAIQEIPEEYITESKLNERRFATSKELEEGLEGKQDNNIYLRSVEASEWTEENKYTDFKFRCDIPDEYVMSDMLAEVIFGLAEASSGDYAPVCETGDGIISIWSSTNKSIVVPTIVIHQ